jgi:hypothetical protein
MILAVTGLRHESVNHAMKRHIVVKMIARELLEPLRMSGRNVIAQLDDDASLRGVKDERVLRVEPGRQRLRGLGGS